MDEEIETSQPAMLWRRVTAFIALAHFCIYSLSRDSSDINSWVIAFDAIIIAYWAIGGAAIIDGILVWKGKK